MDECPVVELRRYTLRPGARETLIELFDREFVETQEAAGMQVLGQFRDLDRPDLFVWLRGFGSMEARRAALEAFYGGPVWAAHRAAANATMIDSDNVLLLRPAWAQAGLQAERARPAPGAADDPPGAGLLDATVFPLREPAGAALLQLVRDTLASVLAEGGAVAQAWYVSEHAPNTFPRLPVREGEEVLVGLALFPDLATVDGFAASGAWQRGAAPLLQPHLAGPPESHRLVPTRRSSLR